MPLPTSLPELAIEGYVHESNGRCKGCGMKLFWFRTKKGRIMPFALKEGTNDVYLPHWANCSAAAQFRKKKA